MGFGSMNFKKQDLLDFLYVHKDYLRKGIASEVLSELERETRRRRKKSITSYVSKTAKAFFVKNGFTLIRENRITKGPTELINYYMRKKL